MFPPYPKTSAGSTLLRLGIVLNAILATLSEAPASLTVTWNEGAFDLIYQTQGGARLMGRLGAGSIPVDLAAPESCDAGAGLCWTFGSEASLKFAPAADGQCYSVEWMTRFDSLGDCYQLGSAHWYGGAEVFEQSWPIVGDTQQMGGGEADMAYVTGDSFDRRFAGVMEPYWINSDGFGVRALRENPLFLGWNSSGSGQLCLNARHDFPYPARDEPLALRYSLCSAPDVKSMHLLALSENFWPKPRDIVDERMLTHPVWSTWARYKMLVNQDRVASFARQIRDYGFNDSQLEIDDRWEDCYGEHRFDLAKFPDPRAMVNDLHDQGFRVTLWMHPFINAECPSFSAAGEHLVGDAQGNPANTSWWQGKAAGYFDFTRQSATEWWSSSVERLRIDYGFDGFKIDAGETNWLPPGFDLSSQLAADATPNGFSTAYVRNMERFGRLTEVRTGWATQDVPVFARMMDKSTVWGKLNGLSTLIPTLLHFNIIGYPFVLPDMIAGNGYNSLLPERELFIRWMQANVFMPGMQFSYAPWDYDQEVIDMARRMTELHQQYAPLIISLARQATVDGQPINRPLWWIDPLDPVAHTIDSEFLLGDDVLVAPVLEKGSLERDIYLPVGTWRDEADPAHPTYAGPIWLTSYPAPLDTLPYFTRVSA